MTASKSATKTYLINVRRWVKTNGIPPAPTDYIFVATRTRKPTRRQVIKAIAGDTRYYDYAVRITDAIPLPE